MIKHIVIWNVKGHTPEEKAESIGSIKAAFVGLIGRIPGLLYLEVGVDSSHIDYACGVVLYSEFDSQESFSAYANHSEHVRIKAELGGLRVARHQIDYAVT